MLIRPAVRFLDPSSGRCSICPWEPAERVRRCTWAGGGSCRGTWRSREWIALPTHTLTTAAAVNHIATPTTIHSVTDITATPTHQAFRFESQPSSTHLGYLDTLDGCTPAPSRRPMPDGSASPGPGQDLDQDGLDSQTEGSDRARAASVGTCSSRARMTRPRRSATDIPASSQSAAPNKTHAKTLTAARSFLHCLDVVEILSSR
jgi:hypothetical protein